MLQQFSALLFCCLFLRSDIQYKKNIFDFQNYMMQLMHKTSNYPPPVWASNQALTTARMVWNRLAPGLRRAVSMTVRISASPWAAHMAR